MICSRVDPFAIERNLPVVFIPPKRSSWITRATTAPADRERVETEVVDDDSVFEDLDDSPFSIDGTPSIKESGAQSPQIQTHPPAQAPSHAPTQAQASVEKDSPSASTTCWMGMPYFFAKAKSRSSCAGTPITAPSP